MTKYRSQKLKGEFSSRNRKNIKLKAVIYQNNLFKDALDILIH